MASAVVTYGESGKKKVQGIAAAANVHVFPNTTGRSPASSDQLLYRVNGRVAYLGRLDRRKRVDLLLDALALVKNEGANVRLRIIGAGPMEDCLVSRAYDLGIAEAVTWHGQLTDWYDVQMLLQDCDLVVLPAHAGLAVVDAMAAGRGCVVPADPSLSPPEADNVVDGLTGLRYAPSTPEGLAACLVKAYREPDSILALSRQAASAYEEGLTLDTVGQAFAELIDIVATDG